MKQNKKLILALIALGLFSANSKAGVFSKSVKAGIVYNVIKATAVPVGTGGVLYHAARVPINGKEVVLSYNQIIERMGQDSTFIENLKKVKNFNWVEYKKYVLNGLNTTRGRDLYLNYKKNAEVLGIENIPPFYDDRNNHQETEILVQPNPNEDLDIGSFDNQETTSPIPEDISDYTNIITSPIGEEVDTSTEFPLEEVTTWEDYLTLKNDSRKLNNRMKAAGYIPLNLGIHAAHHIIPVKGNLAKTARDILANHGININDAINGVYLPTLDNKSATQVIIHNGKHPNIYIKKVNDLIDNADKRGGRQEVINELSRIKNILETAPNQSNWSNIL